MNSRTINLESLDLRPVFAVAVLCAVALMPAPESTHETVSSAYGASLVAAVAEVPFTTTAGSLHILADQVQEINSALVGVASAYLGLFALDELPQAAAATATYDIPAAGESLAMTLAYMPESLYETVGDATDFMAAVEMAPLYVITDALSEALFEAGVY